MRPDRLEPEGLFDRSRDERWILDQFPTLVRVLGEHLHEPADQAAGGLVPSAGEQVRVGEHLLAGQLARRSGLVLELGVQQHRHEVVRRVPRTPLHVFSEHRAAHQRVLIDLHGLAPLSAQPLVHAVAHRHLVGLGNAEQHADHAHRQHRRELGHDVEAVASDEGVEAASAELPRLVLQRGHLLRREHP